jgi:CRP-like cAMP-binding protein
LLLAGRVKISSLTEDGREVVLSIRGAGDLLGELSVIDGEPRSASATALDTVDGLVVGGDELRHYLQEFPRVTLSLLEAVSHRLRESDRKRAEYGAYDTVGRVARRLLELAERFGEPEDGGVRITLPLSQQELAGFTGSSREAVSKALQSLRGRGLIETRRRGILVRDMAGLRRRAT